MRSSTSSRIMNSEEQELPSCIQALENQSGEYSARFASNLPVSLHPLAFCSPASFRDPESDDCWHPFLANQGLWAFMRNQFGPFARAAASGVFRLVHGHRGKGRILRRPGARVLAVGPKLICNVDGDRMNSSYVHAADEPQVNWLIVGQEAKGQRFSRKRVLIDTFWLLRPRFRAGMFGIPSWLVLRWIISLHWVDQQGWLREIRTAFEELQPKEVFCVHEAHPLSRLLWIVCHEQAIPGYTVQHASINRKKLWYFPTVDELEAGQKWPQYFAVYDGKTAELLMDYCIDSCNFELSCGPRYIKWQAQPPIEKNIIGSGKRLLFVTSLASWDNKIVLSALERILNFGEDWELIVRFHPNAKVPSIWRKRVKNWIVNRKVEESKKSLLEETASSSLVIGASTTVLDEASLTGVPTLGLSSSDYLYMPVGTKVTRIEELSVSFLMDVLAGSRGDLISRARDQFGLDLPVFRVVPASVDKIAEMF